MTMKRDSFIFYRSFWESIKLVPEDVQLQLFRAIVFYALDGEIPTEINDICKSLFLLIKPQIDANNKKFLNGSKGKEFGALGGRPKKENPNETPTKPQENPNETPNVNDNVNVNVNDNVNGNVNVNVKERVIGTPTLENVLQYAENMMIDVEMAKKFFYHYDAVEWIDGNGSKIKNWQSKLQSWFLNDGIKDADKKTNKGGDKFGKEWEAEMIEKMRLQDERKQQNTI